MKLSRTVLYLYIASKHATLYGLKHSYRVCQCHQQLWVFGSFLWNFFFPVDALFCFLNYSTLGRILVSYVVLCFRTNSLPLYFSLSQSFHTLFFVSIYIIINYLFEYSAEITKVLLLFWLSELAECSFIGLGWYDVIVLPLNECKWTFKEGDVAILSSPRPGAGLIQE